MLPVLGIVRAPARMVLAADMALATLAAAAIHAMAQPAGATALARLNQTLRRMAHFALPGAMAAVILMLGVLGAATYCRYRFQIPFFTGGAKDIFDVLRLQNPAVWVPIATMVATVVAIRVWLVRPASCAGVLTIVLLADLFMVARFADIPPGGAAVANPDDSPAAQWLRQNDSDTAAYRVYGLSDSYFLRATELLLPKTAQAMGFVPLADYGPFQSPAHAELLGFRIFGTNRDWERLVRRNYLLSLYGVKYLIAEDPKFRRVIESVRMPSASRPADGPNLLAGPWQDERPDAQGVFHLQTAFLWRTAMARQDVKLTPGRVYRIALDARGPDGGAANFLKAQLVREFDVGRPEVSDDWALVVFDEHIGADWRHFEWVLQSPEYSADRESFQLHTSSERPIEVRNVSLRESSLDEPVEFSGTLAPGEAVYELRKELPAVNPNLPPVAVYENHLWRKQSAQPQPAKGVSGDIEMLKWRPDEYVKLSYPIPEIGFTLNSSPGYVALITTVPAVCIWLIALGVCWFATRRG
jgi:hypothetical protein